MTTPDFQWTSLYYPEIFAGLKLLKRTSWPEHTEEDEHDPVIRMYSAYAVVGHMSSVRTDHVARENYWPTLHLRSSAISLARLMDRELLPATPAELDLVADLTAGLSTTTNLVATHSIFATVGADPVLFEFDSDTALTGGATGAFLAVQADGSLYTIPSTPAALWGGTPVAGDAYYAGHADLMFDRVAWDVDVAASGITAWRYEFYDPTHAGSPDSVTDSSGQVRAVIDTVFGPSRGEDAGSGERAQVVIRCLRTGAEETVNVTWSGSQNIALASGALGQASISTSAADYVITAAWSELPGVVDAASASEALDTTGDALETSWTLPQDATRDWTRLVLVDGSAIATLADLAFWVRLRVVAVSTPSSPTVDDFGEPSGTTYSTVFVGRQGRRIVEALGTTDAGTADQAFDLARVDLLELVELTVAATAWTRVVNLLSSASRDKHFTLREEPDGAWRVTFGDGANGKIPTSSSAVVITYRAGGTTSGNVGPSTVTRDRTGNARLRNVRNPRSGIDWTVKEGMTEESLDDLREVVPASLRNLGRAVTPEDHEDLARDYRTTARVQLVSRSLAVEEGNGLKTVALKCVSPAGVAPSVADLAEIDDYFNGETLGVQRIGGVGMANTEVTAEAVSLATISVTATVDVLADYVPGAKAAIEAALSSILKPLAIRDDLYGNGSTTWLWEWGDNGGKVSLAVLQAAITLAVSGVVTSAISSPGADTVLAAGQLPAEGTIAITVVSV